MAFSKEEIRANRDHFAAKLRSEKQKIDVAHRAKGEPGGGEFLLLDVRPRDAFAKAHIAGAASAPLDELDALAAQLPVDRELVTYCWSHTGHLSAKAALQLAELGFFAKEMNAGWAEWTAAGLPIHKGAAQGPRCTCSR